MVSTGQRLVVLQLVPKNAIGMRSNKTSAMIQIGALEILCGPLGQPLTTGVVVSLETSVVDRLGSTSTAL